MNAQMFFSVLMQALAVLLQIAAALLAVRLIRITGWRTSWLAISVAFCIMALRRALIFWQQLAGSFEPQALSLSGDILTAVISLLMLLGVVSISPLLQASKRSEEALRQAGTALQVEVADRNAELQAAKQQLEAELLERRRIEAALQAERRRLFSLLDTLPALVYLKGPDYTIRFANRRFREDYGDPEGRRCYEAFGKTEVCPHCLSLQVQKTGVPAKEEWTRPNGQRTYELIHYPFSDLDDAPLVLTLGIDVTDRKGMEEMLRQSQARLEEAQRFARLGSWEWDLKRNESLWSPEMFRILGLPPQPQGLTNEEFFGHVHPEDRERLQQGLADALSGAEPYGMGFRLRRVDGAEIYVQADAEIIFDDSGQAVKMVGTLQDITARHQVEEQLRQSEASLRHLTCELLNAQENERARIARELHDELGQSLLVMRLQLKGLQRQAPAGDQALAAEYAGLLEQLDRLMENVRRISQDLSPHILEDLGLEAALRRLLLEFGKHYQIDLQMSGELAGFNRSFSAADQIHIYRFFQECLTNIGKHSQADSLRVEITREPGEISILLADNGRGFTVESGKESPAAASGIGLATLAERIRILGGRLSIASEPGKGTSIILALPVASGN